MEKKNFVSMLLGTVGGVLFALGMCMGLIPEWELGSVGIAVGVAGLVVLLATYFVRRKMSGLKMIELNAKKIGFGLLTLVGALAFGFGMSLVMVWSLLISGIVVGLVGLLLLMALVPLYKGIR